MSTKNPHPARKKAPPPPPSKGPWGWLALLLVFSLLSGFSGALAALGMREAGLLPEESTASSITELPHLFAGVGIARTNILLMGSDVAGRGRQGEEGPSRSDTLIVVSLDPKRERINMISIPRDTRVRIPGHSGADKINAAFAYGGPSLAAQTVSDFLGIPIHHWVRLRLDGLVELVDLLGGVEVTIDKNMYYRDRAGGLKISLKRGRHLLNGQQAHQYVRFRHDQLGDIGRVQRQQQFIRAIIEKLLQPETLARLPQLVEAVQSNVETDMSGPQWMRFATWASGVDKSRVRMVMVPGQFSGGRFAASYWIADHEAARRLGRNLFTDETLDPGPGQEAAAPSAQVKRDTRITVLNGTGASGLAFEAARMLRSDGWTVWVVDSAERQDYAKTEVIVQRGDDGLVSSIGRSLGLSTEAVAASVGDVQTDFTVILGQDFVEALRHPRVKAREEKS